MVKNLNFEKNREMLHGHLIEDWYNSIYKSDDFFFIDFIKDIRKAYGYILIVRVVLF